MRKLINVWLKGTHLNHNYETKLRSSEIILISNLLLQCNKRRPAEIQRNIRGLDELSFWKGTEYRVFLLYLGIVVLKDILPSNVYEHFKQLMCAITIASCKTYKKYLNISDSLIKEFLEGCIDIYGIDSISSNFHNLSHLIDDLQNVDSLTEISSYPFETYLGKMKRLIRSGNAPLIQIAKRTKEISFLNSQKSVESKIPTYVTNEIKCNSSIITNKKYKTVHFGEDFMLNNTDKDSWFLTKEGAIASMQYATYHNGSICIYATELKEKNNFFVTPFESSQLNIFESTANT